MENILSGGVAELEAAKAALAESDEKIQAAHVAAMARRSKEKDLNAQQKYVEDKVKSTIKKKRNSLVRIYEDQISASEKEKAATIKSRKAARESAVDSKIEAETQDLVQETNRIKDDLKSAFKRAKVPAFCKTRYYYAMFFPKGAVDLIIFALTTIIAIAVIPNVVIHFLVKTESLFYRILIYAAIVLFFLIVYLLIFGITRGGMKRSAIAQARPLAEKIRSNNRKLNRAKKEIRKTSDDSEFDLGEYDEKIGKINEEIEGKSKEMSAALEEFDKTTAPSIEEDIRSDNQAEIDEMTKALEELTKDAQSKADDATEAKNKVATEYEAYLGSRNMTTERIDEMIALINEGKAETILQALDLLNGEIKQ